MACERLRKARSAVWPSGRRRCLRRSRDARQHGGVRRAHRHRHAVWQKETPEVVFEYAAVRHRDRLTHAVAWTPAFYIQVAHRLSVANDLWKPYFRFEHIDVNRADAMFAVVPSLDQATFGVRYDASTFGAVKAEYRTWTRGAATLRNHGGYFQLCFTF